MRLSAPMSEVSVSSMLRNKVLQALPAIQRQGNALLIAESISLVVIVGVIDALAPWELAFAPFYLIPLFFATYFISTGFGVFTAVLCLISWLLVDLVTHIPYSHNIYHYLNFFIRCCSYLVFIFLLTCLKNVMQLVRDLANTDALTDLPNTRHFFHLAANEIQRASRYHHTITLAYMDLDGFKAINDTIGHKEGDRVLRVVANTLRNNSRSSDLIARLGGDEFAVLMPEGGFDSAELFLRKIQDRLLEAMNEHEWSVTFSIGAVTFQTVPDSVDELLRQADTMMYAVKRSGKNKVRHECAGVGVRGNQQRHGCGNADFAHCE
jgi:diguanylate cyclase (GGDEF)-like protein